MASAPFAKAANPFPGLRPFRDSEEHLFFGRESQVDTMIDKPRSYAVPGSGGDLGQREIVAGKLRPSAGTAPWADVEGRHVLADGAIPPRKRPDSCNGARVGSSRRPI